MMLSFPILFCSGLINEVLAISSNYLVISLNFAELEAIGG